MQIPSASQVAAAGRHVVTFVMGGATFLATLHVISSSDTTTISHSVTQISNGLADIIAGVAPLIAIGSALWSAWTASHKSQIAAVNNSIPGVKVVRDSSPGVPVTEPPKT